MYPFQLSLPLSRPPPVSFSPPKAPPISAPLVPMLTLAMPQSLPAAPRNPPAPAVDDRAALLLDALDRRLHVRHRPGVDQRPHQRAAVQRVADLDLPVGL